MKRRRSNYSQLHSALLVEKKYYDYPFPLPTGNTNQQDTDIGSNTVSALVKCPLLGLSQGVNENQRIGRKVAIHSMHIYGCLTLVENATVGSYAQNMNIRCIIFIDTQNNGTTTTGINEVLDTSPPTTSTIFYFRDLTRGSRFRVLKDEVISVSTSNNINSTDNTYQNRDLKYIEYHHNFTKPLMVEYNGTTGAGSELTQNNIYVAFMKQNNDRDVRFDGLCRIRFSD